MRIVGNILWFLFAGWFCALWFAIIGLVFCITVIGIPIGKQCFKLAKLILIPFGATIV